MDVMSLADRSWPVLRLLMGAHARIYRVSNGLIGHRFPGAPPMLLLGFELGFCCCYQPNPKAWLGECSRARATSLVERVGSAQVVDRRDLAPVFRVGG